MSSGLVLNLIIVIILIVSVIRGWQVGWVRQFCSTAGFFGGLFLGAAISPYFVNLAHTTNSRTLLTICITMGLAILFLTLGEYLGIVLKSKIHIKQLNLADNFFGSLISIVTVVFSIWLMAAILSSLTVPGLQSFIQSSSIITGLNKILPNAPTIVSDFGSLIDPNGFPKVFIGQEKEPLNPNVNLPSLGVLAPAVAKDESSVVKIEGLGCGGIVEGSGFVISSDLVATNAHVVAGIEHPYVIDSNGNHSATLIWYDPNLDFAVLKVTNLAGKPLTLDTKIVANGTKSAALGYPGGGNFNVSPAVVLDEFIATGRNIYGQGTTNRTVYEIKAKIIPGNSGGPLIETNGDVAGVVFAASTTYNNIGYALTANQVAREIHTAEVQDRVVQTGSCAE